MRTRQLRAAFAEFDAQATCRTEREAVSGLAWAAAGSTLDTGKLVVAQQEGKTVAADQAAGAGEGAPIAG